MKLHQSLSLRILLVSILSGAIGLASATLAARYANERIGAHVIGNWMKRVSQRQHTRCEEQPQQWTIGLPGGPQIFAYDAETRISANPSAPPLDAALYAHLSPSQGEPVAEIRASVFGAEGVVQLRAAKSGPCALLQANWPATSTDGQTLLAALVGAVVSVFAAFTLGFGVVVRPLARRVHALANAAGQVGEVSGYSFARKQAQDDELGRVAAALDRAHERIRADAKKLEERRLRLEQHLADIAHDLRTPLTSLQLAIEQASDLAETKDASALFAGALHDCVYLAGLVENLRLATELAEGWDPVSTAPPGGADLHDAVERVVGRLSSLARRRGIELVYALPDDAVSIACNPIACEQAISNLVGNAVLHGVQGGHVAVMLTTEGTSTFCLTVMDDGPGVPPKEIPRLGERTFRSDEARARDPKGQGLGLAITHEICQRAGFVLSFAPAEEKGLCVRMRGEVLQARDA